MDTLKPRPRYSEADLERILATEERIRTRVDQLASEVSESYGGEEITVVCVLSGALVFTSDLIRRLKLPTRLDCIRADSYGNATQSSGSPRIAQSLKHDIAGKRVLIVDDILDTGATLDKIVDNLKQAKPASIKTCVLLDKKERRQVDIDADFVGFEIPDAFVVGYGLDFAEHYRHLPCIGVLKPELQSLSETD
ncbi:MAG: hypoxanthine phosphoribosyltransferase [Opitutales bacterium TMED158]|nr:MAG: hypoxanthine phosphoribosyltransferase [Opitutales bacterium TMED158]